MQVELTQDEINFLTDLVSERLLKMQDEIKKEPEIKPVVAFTWELYHKLLRNSTMPGVRSKTNPYQ